MSLCDLGLIVQDTLFSYNKGGVNGVEVACLGAKQMTIEKTKDKRPVPDILADANKQLKQAMKNGKMLVQTLVDAAVICVVLIGYHV